MIEQRRMKGTRKALNAHNAHKRAEFPPVDAPPPHPDFKESSSTEQKPNVVVEETPVHSVCGGPACKK